MADALYGITMSEPGCSRVISAKLREPTMVWRRSEIDNFRDYQGRCFKRILSSEFSILSVSCSLLPSMACYLWSGSRTEFSFSHFSVCCTYSLTFSFVREPNQLVAVWNERDEAKRFSIVLIRMHLDSLRSDRPNEDSWIPDVRQMPEMDIPVFYSLWRLLSRCSWLVVSVSTTSLTSSLTPI